MTVHRADTSHIRLRLRREFLQRLQREASRNDRTLTDEIVRRLERTVANDDSTKELVPLIVAEVAKHLAKHPQQAQHPQEKILEGWSEINGQNFINRYGGNHG